MLILSAKATVQVSLNIDQINRYRSPYLWAYTSKNCNSYISIDDKGKFLCGWICSPLKKYLSLRSFAWAFAAKMLEISLSRLRMTWSFLQHLSTAVCRFSRGPAAGNHRQHFFDPTGSNAIKIALQIENICPEAFPAFPGAQLQEITVSTFWIQLGQYDSKSSIGSKKPFFSIRSELYSYLLKTVFFSIRSEIVFVFVLFRSDGRFWSCWPSWIEKVLAVISCNWAPGEAGNSSG